MAGLGGAAGRFGEVIGTGFGLARTAFPKGIWRQICSNNPQERLD